MMILPFIHSDRNYLSRLLRIHRKHFITYELKKKNVTQTEEEFQNPEKPCTVIQVSFKLNLLQIEEYSPKKSALGSSGS